jgi:hypothetical protein
MNAVLVAKSKARLTYPTLKHKIPSNLTPPKDFWFVLALLRLGGQRYLPTSFDTPSTRKAWKWLVRWKDELGEVIA